LPRRLRRESSKQICRQNRAPPPCAKILAPKSLPTNGTATQCVGFGTLFAETVMPLKFVTSTRGQLLLCVDGYVFRKDRETNGRTTWRCNTKTCKARVSTQDDTHSVSRALHFFDTRLLGPSTTTSSFNQAPGRVSSWGCSRLHLSTPMLPTPSLLRCAVTWVVCESRPYRTHGKSVAVPFVGKDFGAKILAQGGGARFWRQICLELSRRSLRGKPTSSAHGDRISQWLASWAVTFIFGSVCGVTSRATLPYAASTLGIPTSP